MISQPPGNNPSYYYRASPTLPQLYLMLPETPYVLYMQLTSKVTHRNGTIKHIFYTNQIHGGIVADCSLFILSLHALYLPLAVNMMYEDLSTLLPYICRLYFPQNASRTALFTQPILLSENILIFDIKSSTKHKEVRPDWNDKNDNTTTRHITWKVLPMAQVAIFKEIFDQVRKDLDCELFYSELNVTTSHIIFINRR